VSRRRRGPRWQHEQYKQDATENHSGGDLKGHAHTAYERRAGGGGERAAEQRADMRRHLSSSKVPISEPVVADITRPAPTPIMIAPVTTPEYVVVTVAPEICPDRRQPAPASVRLSTSCPGGEPRSSKAGRQLRSRPPREAYGSRPAARCNRVGTAGTGSIRTACPSGQTSSLRYLRWPQRSPLAGSNPVSTSDARCATPNQRSLPGEAADDRAESHAGAGRTGRMCQTAPARPGRFAYAQRGRRCSRHQHQSAEHDASVSHRLAVRRSLSNRRPPQGFSDKPRLSLAVRRDVDRS